VMSGGMATPYEALRTPRRGMMPGVPIDRADIRLPSSEHSPLSVLLRRLGVAALLVVIVSLITYLDREGFRDSSGDPIDLLDAFYFGAVSVTSTGYGDITPVTDGARLVNIFVVMPAGVLFLVILVSTTLEVLAERTRTVYREKLWRRTLQDHTIVCGYGVKGRSAIETLRAHGVAADRIVVIDARPDAVEDARRAGHAGVVGDASGSAALDAAGVREASAVVVAPDRDDSAVLITLTARELNPRARIVASVRESENAHLLQQGGADSVVVSSGAAGRLLGHAVKSPRVVQVLEDLLSVGEGLDVTERDVTPEEAGMPLGSVPTSAPIIAVVRGEDVLRFDDQRVGELRAGDRLVCLCSN
jgi:voltage-gated potassium channel